MENREKLVKEYENLLNKVVDFDSRIAEEKTSKDASSEYVYLMQKQAEAMHLYLHFLDERIEYLTDDEEELEEEEQKAAVKPCSNEGEEKIRERIIDLDDEDDDISPSDEVLELIKKFAHKRGRSCTRSDFFDEVSYIIVDI